MSILADKIGSTGTSCKVSAVTTRILLTLNIWSLVLCLDRVDDSNIQQYRRWTCHPAWRADKTADRRALMTTLVKAGASKHSLQILWAGWQRTMATKSQQVI